MNVDFKPGDPSAVCSECNGQISQGEPGCQALFAHPHKMRGKPVVLLADDDDVLLYVLSLRLEKDGFEVVTAKNGREAMDLIASQDREFNAVVSDFAMPGADGEQLARLNSQTRNFPFIIHTGNVIHDAAIKMVGLGVENFVLKSGDLKPLLRVLKSVVYRKMYEVPEAIKCQSFDQSGMLVIGTSMRDLAFASSWLTGRLKRLFPYGKIGAFISNVEELFMNAYEHGNLGLTYQEKADLIENGRYNDELAEREKNCNLSICVKFNVLGNQAAVSIKDEGSGFDHRKYLSMTESQIAKNILNPNGRGIFMSSKYFDSIKYNEVGNEVFVIGRLGPASDS